MLHSGATRTPTYVAQRLNRNILEDANEKRAKRFFADARLPRGERAELEDYKNSGYSRGHMAPAGDMSTPTAMAQSFSLANMVPQNARHNGGAWNKIEQNTRHYVQRAKGDVFVITRPVFTDAGPCIGANGVKVAITPDMCVDGVCVEQDLGGGCGRESELGSRSRRQCAVHGLGGRFCNERHC